MYRQRQAVCRAYRPARASHGAVVGYGTAAQADVKSQAYTSKRQDDKHTTRTQTHNNTGVLECTLCGTDGSVVGVALWHVHQRTYRQDDRQCMKHATWDKHTHTQTQRNTRTLTPAAMRLSQRAVAPLPAQRSIVRTTQTGGPTPCTR